MYSFIKRFFDLAGSLTALTGLLPLYFIIALMVKLDSKGNIIFAQIRLGKGGKKIKVYKFRTMAANAEKILQDMPDRTKKEFEENFKFENDPRITKVGRILRETSLDELPQLINILKGDMSIVGPRPIVENELKKYGKYGNKLLSIRPGLTGYWQVSGRSSTTYDERINLDMEYIDKRNLLMDIAIIIKTFGVVYKRIGAR